MPRLYHLALLLCSACTGPVAAHQDATPPDAAPACTPPLPAPANVYAPCDADPSQCGEGTECRGTCTPSCCLVDSQCPDAPAGVTGRPFCHRIDGLGLCLLGCSSAADCPAGARCTNAGAFSYCDAP
jgi:hypothetical protein